MAFAGDEAALQSLLEVKQQKKQELADYLEKTQDLILDPKSIYDIQIKRLHEYKRQQMNALYVIYKYLKIMVIGVFGFSPPLIFRYL